MITENLRREAPAAVGRTLASWRRVVNSCSTTAEPLGAGAFALSWPSYLRQTARTNSAAVVPEGATKPTSVYTFTRIEDKLDVVAHLSEGVPRYGFADNDALQHFLENELQCGLQVAVEPWR
jgi:hypothetical protein